MFYCSNCGAQLRGDMNFCPSCGNRAANGADDRRDPRPQSPEYSVPPPHDRAEVLENKIMAVLAYLLFLVPLLAASKEQRFVRYHTNQGLVLFLFGAVLRTALLLLTGAFLYPAMTHNLTVFHQAAAALIGMAIHPLSILYFVFCIIDIINAGTGQMKPLPLIGRITLLK